MNQWLRLPVLVLCLTVLTTTLPSATYSQDGFVHVAADRWHFEMDGQTFVPYGVNYTPDWAGWPPSTLFETRFWDPGKVEADFAAMQALGLNVTKLMLGAQYLLPGDTVEPEHPQLNPDTLSKIDTILAAAGRHNLKLILVVDPLDITPYPPSPDSPARERWFWTDGGSGVLFANPYDPKGQNGQPLVRYTSSRVLGRMWQQIAARYRDNPSLMGYSLSVEAPAADMWYKLIAPDFLVDEWSVHAPCTLPQAAFNAYLHQKYASYEELAAAWGNRAPSRSQWDGGSIPASNCAYDAYNPNYSGLVKIPECANYTENYPDVYDFQLFREWNTFRFFKDQVDGIRSADPNHLISAGFRPEFTLFREQDLAAYANFKNGKARTPWGCGSYYLPGGVPSYNPQELARIFDYLSLHTYYLTPPGFCERFSGPPECYPQIVDNVGLQYRIMRLAARWSYNLAIPRPVLLDEFDWVSSASPYIGPSLPPDQDNVVFSAREMQNLAGDVSGFIVWTWANNPNAINVTTGDPDVISQSSGLVSGTQHSLTQWGQVYRDLKDPIAAQVSGSRKAPDHIVSVMPGGSYDKQWLVTSKYFQSPNVHDTLFHLTSRTMGANVPLDHIGDLPVPDFSIEFNPMIDTLMAAGPVFPTITPTPSSLPSATPTATATRTPMPSATTSVTPRPSPTLTWTPPATALRLPLRQYLPLLIRERSG